MQWPGFKSLRLAQTDFDRALAKDLTKLEQYLGEVAVRVATFIEREPIATRIPAMSDLEIIAGAELNGGGTLTADITINHDTAPITPGAYPYANVTVNQYGHVIAITAGTPVTGTGTTSRYPIFTDGPAGVIGDGSIFNSGGNVIVDQATLRVENSSAGQLRLQNSSGQVLDFSVNNLGAATIDAAGTSPQITFTDRVTVTNDSATTMAIRRTAGGGTDGLGIVVGGAGTTITIVAGTSPRTGLVIQQSASWASGKMLDFVNELGTSRFNIDAATGAVGYHTASTAGTALADFGNATTAVATNFVIGANFGPKWGAAGTSATFLGVAAATCAGYFNPTDTDSTAGGVFTALLAGGFENRTVAISRNHTEIYGAVFRAVGSWQSGTTGSHGNIYGWRVRGIAANSKPGPTATALYGGYIDNLAIAATPATPSTYGLYIEEQTRGTTLNNSLFLANATSGRKLIVMRDQTVGFGSDAAGELSFTFTATNLVAYDDDLVFYDDELVHY